jgi:hypothetical protein
MAASTEIDPDHGILAMLAARDSYVAAPAVANSVASS